MSSQGQPVWGTKLDDFFNYAISTSSLGQCAPTSWTGSAPQHMRPHPIRNESSATTASYDSGLYSLSPSVPDSPAVDSPTTAQDNQINGTMQLVWAAEEAHDFAFSRPCLPDQHHEKSCTRCSLTEAEARKCRLDRRREQNRESQRKFRARKEAKIREAANQVAALETYVDFLEKHNNDLESLNAKLQQQIASFDSNTHLCTIDMNDLASQINHMTGSENWPSRTSVTVSSTSAEMSKSFDIPDLRVSPFDDELLQPLDARGGIY